MKLDIHVIRNYLSMLSLNKKLVALMLVQSISIIAILVFLYYQTETSIYNEFEKQIDDLSRGIQMGIEEVTSSGLSDQKRLQNYLKKLKTKGVKEVSIISNSDRIVSSTDPRNIGKWITRAKKELIFKAQLGEPVVGEGQFYNVIVPVVAGNKHYDKLRSQAKLLPVIFFGQGLHMFPNLLCMLYYKCLLGNLPYILDTE